MNLSENFTRKEFECKCGCGYYQVEKPLLDFLEGLRAYYNLRYKKVWVKVTGGNRCIKRNEKVQKRYVKDYIPFSSKSTHLPNKKKKGEAADFKIFYIENGKKKQVPPLEIHQLLNYKYPNSYGFGLYRNRNHTDCRKGKKARWEKS